jgi:hypothetical protein
LLRDAVIVVAADGMMGSLADPVDARDRLEAVIHQVAEAEADIVRLLERLQGRPVGVDVCNEKNAHRRRAPPKK